MEPSLLCQSNSSSLRHIFSLLVIVIKMYKQPVWCAESAQSVITSNMHSGDWCYSIALKKLSPDHLIILCKSHAKHREMRAASGIYGLLLLPSIFDTASINPLPLGAIIAVAGYWGKQLLW